MVSAFEATIWHECQHILNNRKMKKKELLEWSTGEVKAADGEIVIRLDSLQLNAVVPAYLDKRATTGA